MTPPASVDPVIVLYAARYAFGRQTGAPRDALSAIVINAESIRRDAGVCDAIKRLLSEDWVQDWDRELGPLRDTAFRLLTEDAA